MIIVTGATGTVGSELVRQLSDADEPVRALSRNPEVRARPLPGVEWVEADLAHPERLAETFAGGDRLFLLTGNTEDMVWLQENAVQAAREAGVGHVVKLSALGASDHSNSVIGVWHHVVERILRESELSWTFLRPHHYMQNLLDPVTFDRGGGRVHSASGEGGIPFIDARDIAACARVVLTDGDHDGRTYSLTGSEAISYGRATDILSDVLDRDLTYVAETMDEAWERLRATGMPVWLTAARLTIAGYQRRGGPTERTSDAVENLTGRPPRTFRDFAVDHAEELAG